MQFRQNQKLEIKYQISEIRNSLGSDASYLCKGQHIFSIITVHIESNDKLLNFNFNLSKRAIHILTQRQIHGF